MPLPLATNHVFIDFENVPEIDLSVIGTRAVTFTLLVGAGQKKIDTALVEKLLAHADAVHLIRLTSPGKNALDFTLAYYLGRAVLADPTGGFHIVSKDKGYDPLLAHLRSQRIQADRHETFAGLPFAARPGHGAPAAATDKPSPAPRAAPVEPKPTLPALDERATRVLTHLSRNAKSRPAREKTLIRTVIAQFGNPVMTESEAGGVITALRQAGYLTINDKGAVTYRLPAPAAS